MQISPEKVVSLTYTLTLDGGEIADQTTEENPFTFIHGTGQTLEMFDKNLEGLTAGETFSFKLNAEDGYGTPHPDMIVDLPMSVFEGEDVPDDLLAVGNLVPMQDQEGNPMNGIVLEIAPDKVKIDFNHPLAGKSLNFEGVIIQVRPATADELSHGHVHGPGGHHH